jgi:tetratricopeptide (TPR) repeat protein
MPDTRGTPDSRVRDLVILADRLAIALTNGDYTQPDAVQLLAAAVQWLSSTYAVDDLLALLSDRYDTLRDGNAAYALAYATIAAEVAHACDSQKWTGWTHHDLGKLLMQRGRPDLAEPVFRRSLEAFSNDRPRRDVVLGDLGACLRALDRLPEAREYLTNALDAALRTDSTHNQLEWRLELGNTLGFMGENDEALRHLTAGLQQARSSGQTQHESAFLTALANLHENLGNIDDSVRLHREALALSIRIGHAEYEARDHLNLGSLLSRLDEPTEARACLDRAVALSAHAHNDLLRVDILNAQALLLFRQREYAPAIKVFETAIANARSHGLLYQLQRSLGNLASVYVRTEALQQARPLYEEALSISQQTRDGRSVTEDLLNLYELLIELGETGAASTYADRALVAARQLNDPFLLAHAEWAIARSLPADRQADAWPHYVAAIEAFERPRGTVKADRDRVGLYTDQRPKRLLYADAVSWLVDHQRIDEAFAWAERAKSRLLLDSLSLKATGSLSDADTAADLRRRLAQASPRSACVSFLVTRTSILLFLVSPSDADAIQCVSVAYDVDDWLPWIKRWFSLVNRIHSEVPSLSRDDADAWLSELESRLVHHVRRWMRAHPSCERLIVVPHNILHLLPIHASLDRHDGGHLAAIAHVVMVPALQLIEPARPPHASASMLVVSSPDCKLAPLPEAEREASFIADLFKATHLTGRHATVARIIEASKSVDMVHLACHGAIDPERSDRSGLVLTDDEVLSAAEIARCQFSRLDLVVNAACHSATVDVRGVDEVIGVIRGWLLAGATHVISSLWAADDLATHRFMKTFYGLVRGGRSYGEAFRQAQTMLMHGDTLDRDPRVWGAFVMVTRA